MAEYISKEKVLNLIEHNDKVSHYADERYENVVYATTQAICRAVAEMPAADVQPVKHGRWITVPGKYGDHFLCSNCGTAEITESGEDGAVWWHDEYCRKCGARMDGGEQK